MNRFAVVIVSAWVVLAAAIVGVGTVGATPASAPSDGVADGLDSPHLAQTDGNTSEENTTNSTDGDNTTTENESIAPGVQLAGVIGVQQAEVRGEVDSRAFGLTVAGVRSNGSRAMVVANQTERLRERIQTLENRTRELNESFQNGTIPKGKYQAQTARLTAQIRMTERLINQTSETATGLPAEALRANGVNTTQLEDLRTRARNMTGPEVAAIAKKMAGSKVGHPVGKESGPPEGTPGGGPPEDTPGADSDGEKPGNGQGQGGGHGQPGTGPATNTTHGPGNNSGHAQGPPGQEDGPPGQRNVSNMTGTVTNQTEENATAVQSPFGEVTAFLRSLA